MKTATKSHPSLCRVGYPVAPSRRQCTLFLATTVILLTGLHFTQTVRRTRPQPPDVCHLIGINPNAKDLWQFSSRSLCLSSSVCLNAGDRSGTLYHASDLSATRCEVNNPDFTPTDINFPAFVNSTWRTCREFQHDLVHCAHGTGLLRATPVCPVVEPVLSSIRDAARWHEDVSILVPDYAYTRNIYHFANPIADLARTVEHLDVLLHRWGIYNVRGADGRPYFASDETRLKKLNIIFQGSKDIPVTHRWKRELLLLIIRERMEKKGITVSLYFLPHDRKQTGYVCLRNAVVLGRRGHFDVWPFPNATEAPLDGFSVPADAVTLKRAMFDGLGIRARLPDMPDARSGHAMSELPPFTVAYARRDDKPDVDGYYKGGSMRKFFEDDEVWFTEMLQNETKVAGAKLIIISANSVQSLKTQVEAIVKAGFIVGIHGANLVNSMFMVPFGVLMEILPKFVDHRCYVAGANSGLKYLSFESSEEAGVLESGCYFQDAYCKKDPRQRAVKLGASADRKRVRELVQEGIEHLRQLRERFPSGVPVRYNQKTVYYEVSEHT